MSSPVQYWSVESLMMFWGMLISSLFLFVHIKLILSLKKKSDSTNYNVMFMCNVAIIPALGEIHSINHCSYCISVNSVWLPGTLWFIICFSQTTKVVNEQASLKIYMHMKWCSSCWPPGQTLGMNLPGTFHSCCLLSFHCHFKDIFVHSDLLRISTCSISTCRLMECVVWDRKQLLS